MAKFNINDPEAVAIREKVQKLSAEYDEVELYDTISIEEVRQFEADNNVRLPDDYVWFITNVGDGGMWYNGMYRFYPLKEAEFSYEELSGYKRGREKYALNVLSKGCSYSFGIILCDEHFGEISSNDGLFASYSPKMTVHGFKELMLKWLDEACLGYELRFLEQRSFGTIEEDLVQYRKEHDIFLLSSIYSKVTIEITPEQFVSDCYDLFLNETVNKNKVLLASILFKAGYGETFSVLDSIFLPENYNEIVYLLGMPKRYYKNKEKCELSEDAGRYYPMLVKMMKHYENAQKNEYHFRKCFDMTVLNPNFNAKDIEGILESDEKEFLTFLTHYVSGEKILERVGKYVEKAKIKYANKS